MQKLKVGVLMGGKSIEREVSFNSGRTICDHLDTSRYEVIPLFQSYDGSLFILPWKFLYRGKIADFEARLKTQALQLSWDTLKTTVDFIYIALHGKYAEDGTLQGFLEILQIPYLGPKVFGSALSMDKVMQKKFLKHHGITVPHHVHISPTQLPELTPEKLEAQLQQEKISFPCIVKPYKEGSSLGISLAFTPLELYDAVHKAAIIDPRKIQDVLIEEKISGMEFSCITLNDYAKNSVLLLPPTEIVPEPNTHIFDYEQKYMPGRSIKFTPARCAQESLEKIQKTCLRVMQALELSMARIDGFLTESGDIVIIDPNALSGMAPSSFLFRQAAELNLSHTQIINHLIESELHYYHMNRINPTHKDQSLHAQQKIRVGVLFGGRSNEKEISLESGRNILYKLSPENYEGVALFVSSTLELFVINEQILVRNSTKEIEADLSQATPILWNDLPKFIDFAFIGLHGGEGENGCVQGTLEMLGIPYNGSSVLTSALCMNKHKTNELLRAEGFDVPQSVFVSAQKWQAHKTEIIEKIKAMLNFPCIIKPHDDGCSVLVTKAKNQDDLEQFCDMVFATTAKSHLLVEEFIQGMELTVGVIGNDVVQALPPSQAIAQGGILSIEEKFLPGAGENQTPAPLPYDALALVKKSIENVYKTVGACGYARIDCFYQDAQQSPTQQPRVIILEINTLPGMTPATCIFHQAAEIDIKPMDFIDTIIRLGFEKHLTQKNTSLSLPHEHQGVMQELL